MSDLKKYPVAGIYESNTPRYAGFIIRKQDVKLSYQSGMGCYVAFARPFDKYGIVPSCYGDDYSHPFVMERDIGELIEEG
jgi:hypothetical protein